MHRECTTATFRVDKNVAICTTVNCSDMKIPWFSIEATVTPAFENSHCTMSCKLVPIIHRNFPSFQFWWFQKKLFDLCTSTNYKFRLKLIPGEEFGAFKTVQAFDQCLFSKLVNWPQTGSTSFTWYQENLRKVDVEKI